MSQFKDSLYDQNGSIGGAVEVHGVDMNEADQLGALEGAVLTLEPTMASSL